MKSFVAADMGTDVLSRYSLHVKQSAKITDGMSEKETKKVCGRIRNQVRGSRETSCLRKSKVERATQVLYFSSGPPSQLLITCQRGTG